MSTDGSLSRQKVKTVHMVANKNKSGPFPERDLGIPLRTSSEMHGLTPEFPCVHPPGTHRHGWSGMHCMC